MTIKASKNLAVNSSVVLAKIKELASKHEVKKTISVDTLALIFGLQPLSIIQLIKELEDNGDILRSVPTTSSKRSSSLGVVDLL
jgi:hypothetical protein